MDNNNPNKPTPQAPLSSFQSVSPSPKKPANKNYTKLVMIFIAVCTAILVIVAIGGWGLAQNNSAKSANSEVDKLKNDNKNLNTELEQRKDTTGEENIDEDAFQSVFLKNKQVYFGKITKITASQITLKNIFYLKTGEAGGNVSSLEGDVSLVKLGNELHGPQDAMYIERKEVQFWENLKPDGQVSKAIKEYEKAN